MKTPEKSLSTVLLIFSSILFLFSAETMAQNKLEIKITNIKLNKGKIIVEIYDSKKSWLKTPFKTIILSTEESTQMASFNVPYGHYAVTIYQDVNDNGTADMNFIEIPKEPVGFGNNYKPFGEPKYEKALITFQANSKPIVIKLYDVL